MPKNPSHFKIPQTDAPPATHGSPPKTTLSLIQFTSQVYHRNSTALSHPQNPSETMPSRAKHGSLFVSRSGSVFVSVQAHALPNKFFEFVQARLAVAIGPSPEMAGLARQYGFGVIAQSFAPRDLAERLNRMTADEIQTLKLAAHRAAKDLCAENNAPIIRAEVERVLSKTV